MTNTQPYLDAVHHAEQTGTDWRYQYILDCGWDSDSIRATAEQGASDYDRDALGDRADDLVQWCRACIEAEQEEQSESCECCGEPFHSEDDRIEVFRPDVWDEIKKLSAMGASGHPTEMWCEACTIERLGPDYRNSQLLL